MVLYTLWLVMLSATTGDRVSEARVLVHPVPVDECITALLAQGPHNSVDGKVVIYECRKETIL